MKKLPKTLTIALAVLLCAAAQSMAATVTLNPIHDSYVWLDDDGDGGNNFGASNYMIVGEWDGDSPYGICRPYLMFDLSSIPAGQTITSATLHLNCRTLYSATVTTGAHFLSDDTWTEYNITWDNAPTGFNAAPTDTTTLAIGDNTWNVTTDVSLEYAGNKVYSVVMKLPVEAAGTEGAWLDSKEYSDQTVHPSLVVTYDATTPPDPVLKFQQLPLDGIFNGENDDYFGHDELSTAYTAYNYDVPVGQDPIPIGYQGCYMADDFADLVNTPVIQIKWWGSYLENIVEMPVQRFLIVFETDVPAVGKPGDIDYVASHPGEILSTEIVTRDADGVLTAGEFSETLFASGPPRCEDLYEYQAVLANPFPEQANTVYWLKIVALIDAEPAVMLTIQTCGIAPCELGKLTWQQILGICPALDQYPPLTRWGWHNRDYTQKDPYASVPPAVIPGEFLAGTVTTPMGVDLEVWHFQDDCVSGELFVTEDLVVNQYSWQEEYYKHQWPLCAIIPPATGVDGPPEIDAFSKDLAFELYTEGDDPDPDMDFGDAPDGGIAYPGTFSVTGIFPTCTTGASTTWIQHTNFGAWFGPMVDFEPDGNAGLCPGCFPTYDDDECFQDGDAGLLFPDSFTIDSANQVVTCSGNPGTSLGQVCTTAVWGVNIDIDVTNFMPSNTTGYVNVLVDWDQGGSWGGSVSGAGCSNVPEHVLVDFPVPNGYSGPLSGLMAAGTGFTIGPNAGYVWVRFSITEVPVTPAGAIWIGDGSFEDGETEDYLLQVDPVPSDEKLKFRQLPLDGAMVRQTAYYGHDEVSTVYPYYGDPGPVPMIERYLGCYMADDFADYEHSPVIRVKWWGSYLGNEWIQPVNSFIIAFESDFAGPPSHPLELLQFEEVMRDMDGVLTAGEFTEVAISGGGAPCYETLYEYEAILANPFPQDPNTVYWLKIVAVVDLPPDHTFFQDPRTNPDQICDFLNYTYDAQYYNVTRWGWHNRDYTRMDPYAATPPAVVPGEHVQGNIPDGTADGVDVWHFQDDSVTGAVQMWVDADDPAVPKIVEIEQLDWLEQFYKYALPYCGTTQGVDGPDEIEQYSKDLAFELWTNNDPSCWYYSCFSNGDANGDCAVTFGDLSVVINSWPPLTYDACADFNKDGAITFGDLSVIINHWPPLPGCSPGCVPMP